nr:MAG TPA: hypothetical protein [Caudoviricetes sp.]DAY40545.1 MAG TPA: hypothetical protein [Bacteriophage sp.]
MTMNNRELWILIAAYTFLVIGVILITGKWW